MSSTLNWIFNNTSDGSVMTCAHIPRVSLFSYFLLLYTNHATCNRIVQLLSSQQQNVLFKSITVTLGLASKLSPKEIICKPM